MVGRTCRCDQPSEAALKLGEQIAALIINSGASYLDADCALEAAQNLLYEKTAPARLQSGNTSQAAQ